MSENSDGKRKNLSRSKHLKECSTKDETVIKCSLSGVLIEKNLSSEIDKWVINCSKVINRGSLVFNWLLLYCLNNNIELPDLNDQTLYNQCYNIGIGKPQKIITQIQSFWNKYSSCFPKIDKIDGDIQVYGYATKTYMTNFFNDLIGNFKERQKTFIKLWLEKHNYDKNIWYNIGCVINGWKCENSVFPLPIWNFIHNNQKILRIYGQNVEITKLWLKEHPKELVYYYYNILGFMELIDKGRKFTLAPISSIKRHFITIDTVVLFELMYKINKINHFKKKQVMSNFKEIKEDHWSSIFNYEHLSRHEFTHLCETDGVSINFHFRQPKRTNKINQTNVKNQNVRVIANDPGRTNIFFGVEQLENNTIKTYKLTKGKYYNESGMNKHKYKTDNWQKEIENEELKYREISLKTIKEENFIKFIQNYSSVYDNLWENKIQKKRAREKFRVYTLKQKCLDRFFSSFCEEDKTKPIIAYGAAKFSPNGKHELSSPTTSISKKCSQHYKTEFVDEFNTTRICHDCDNLLNKVIKIVDGKIRDVRGLKLCCSTSCHSSFKNRDLNAALNILRCYKSSIRPPSLSRNSPCVGLRQSSFRLRDKTR